MLWELGQCWASVLRCSPNNKTALSQSYTSYSKYLALHIHIYYSRASSAFNWLFTDHANVCYQFASDSLQ